MSRYAVECVIPLCGESWEVETDRAGLREVVRSGCRRCEAPVVVGLIREVAGSAAIHS